MTLDDALKCRAIVKMCWAFRCRSLSSRVCSVGCDLRTRRSDRAIADEVMPPLDIVKLGTNDPVDIGNLSVLTPVEVDCGVVVRVPV